MIIHSLPLFILLLLGSTLSAQVKPGSKPKSAVQAGFNYSVELGYRRLINTKGTSYLDEVIHFRDSTESPRLSYTTGLSLLFPILKSWAIESGLQYSNTRFMRIQTSDPDHAPNRLIKQTSFFNYHYVNFPFRLKWTLGNSKLRMVAGIGVSANLFLKDTQCHTYDYDNGTSEEKKGPSGFKYHQFSIAPNISLGITYPISQHLDLLLEPIFRYGLAQTVKQPISNYLYSGGLNIALLFKK